jgi:ribose transport system permease protein
MTATVLMMAAVCAALFVILAITAPSFLSYNNLINVARQISFIAVCAVGMTFVILSGNIDLSVGSIVAMATIITCSINVSGWHILLSFLGAAAVGALCGAINGVFVAYRKIPAFIVTLATMQIFRGFIHLYTKSQPIYGMSDALTVIGRGTVLGIPYPVIYMIAVFILGYFVLRGTTFGKYTYAIGGNKEAARLAGIQVKMIEWMAFVIIGLCAGVAGFLLAGRMGIGQPNVAEGWELDVIAAVYLGGARINGGAGSLVGTFIGTLIMGLISNGLNLIGSPYYLELMMKGLVILIALEINNTREYALKIKSKRQ